MRSMTGCGIGRVLQDGWEVTAELKTVNHRFLDVSLRLPREIAFLEQPARALVGQRLKRGHVDVFLTVRNADSSEEQMTTDTALAWRYFQAGQEIADSLGIANDLTVSQLMAMDGVVTRAGREMDQEQVTRICEEALHLALTQVIDMREREGVHLRQDLAEHLAAAAVLRDKILTRAPGVVEDYRQRLESRIQALTQNAADPQRLAQEVAIMADRCAIDEELARLESHLRQLGLYLDAREEIGKKMDFLIQEMNREANTIGSKASDGAITQWVVDLKSEIEKMREQIQNAE